MAFAWNDVFFLSIFASVVAAVTIGLAYALGQFLSNPKFNVWAKTEFFQVIVSVVLVFLALFLVGLIGLDPSADFVIDAGWITTLSETDVTTVYNNPPIGATDSVFDTDEKYLKNLAFFAHRSVRGARALMGSTDEMSKYTRTPCTPALLLCLMGVNGINVRPLSGAAALMQTSNVLLYTSTTAYLTILAQIFFLKFIQSGLIIVYLPLAIILRSLPFMRPFGGALLAICFALFIIFPMLLFVEAVFWNPYEWTDDTGAWDSVGSFVSDIEGKSGDTAYGDLFKSVGSYHFSDINDEVPNIIEVTSASFVCSTFLFAFNILTVSAAAMLFARLLGAEVDLSRLVQIV